MRTSLPKNINQDIKDGEILVGDDFDLDALNKWYAEEKEAFYESNSDSGEVDPWYRYMRFVNDKLVFSKIKKNISQGSILFIGAGDGSEAIDFHRYNPNWHYNFIESSEEFKSILSKRFQHSNIIEPCVSGDILLEDNTQDVVCAFCVLHHIANVSHVVKEFYRVVKPGGHLFIREPCSSMGDWRFDRSATPNERGISKKLMVKFAADAGFSVDSTPLPIVFEPINKILRKTIGFKFIPFSLLYVFDLCVSWLLSFNDYYWRDTRLKKIGPSSYSYVFYKPKR